MLKKILVVLVTALLFFSCSKKANDQIIFDNSDPLSLSPNIQWAVVIEPYASLRKETSFSGSATGYCRKGDILQVIGSETKEKEEINLWYKFEKGWLPSTSVTIYSNKLKAEKASKSLQ